MFDASGGYGTGLVDDDQDQDFALLALGDGFGRIELAGDIELFQVLADDLGPRTRLVGLRTRCFGRPESSRCTRR